MRIVTNTDVHQKINIRAELIKWAPKTKDILKKNIQKRKLIDTKDLEQSLQSSHSINPQGISTFQISYLLYGKMVDMGAFGGKSALEGRQNAVVERLSGNKVKRLSKRQHQWYSKTMYGSISWLSYKMMEMYGFQAEAAIKLPELVEV